MFASMAKYTPDLPAPSLIKLYDVMNEL